MLVCAWRRIRVERFHIGHGSHRTVGHGPNLVKQLEWQAHGHGERGDIIKEDDGVHAKPAGKQRRLNCQIHAL